LKLRAAVLFALKISARTSKSFRIDSRAAIWSKNRTVAHASISAQLTVTIDDQAQFVLDGKIAVSSRDAHWKYPQRFRR
jgi:hypothetical protein